jgi:hypothetical protein
MTPMTPEMIMKRWRSQMKNRRTPVTRWMKINMTIRTYERYFKRQQKNKYAGASDS